MRVYSLPTTRSTEIPERDKYDKHFQGELFYNVFVKTDFS